MTSDEAKKYQERTVEFLNKAGIVVTEEEKKHIVIADNGLDNIEAIGCQLLTLTNTGRYSAKEVVLFPRQSTGEHWHPPVGSDPGKMETIRCRWGTLYVYVPGEETDNLSCKPPAGQEKYYTVWHEVLLRPADQITVKPGTKHWFQAGEEGAVFSEFSSPCRDEYDEFTNPNMRPIVMGLGTSEGLNDE